jgi:hypothetical protein
LRWLPLRTSTLRSVACALVRGCCGPEAGAADLPQNLKPSSHASGSSSPTALLPRRRRPPLLPPSAVWLPARLANARARRLLVPNAPTTTASVLREITKKKEMKKI